MSSVNILNAADQIFLPPDSKAATLALSKGGWEGWLQVELWYVLTVVMQISVEREFMYPASNERVDLITQAQAQIPATWAEIKAFGVFREGDEDAFLESIRKDVLKLDHRRPRGDEGLMLVVVPNAVGERLHAAISRIWPGFEVRSYEQIALFYIVFEPQP